MVFSFFDFQLIFDRVFHGFLVRFGDHLGTKSRPKIDEDRLRDAIAFPFDFKSIFGRVFFALKERGLAAT